MHKEQILVISLDNKFGQGEDFQIVEDYDQAIVIGVFDLKEIACLMSYGN